MKINKNVKIAIFSFLVLGLATATAVSAHQGLNRQNIKNGINLNQSKDSINYENRINRMRAFHESMSEEDLKKMNQMHELMINGEYEKALQLRDEIGISKGMRGSHMNRQAMGFMDANNNDICDNMENIQTN